MENLWDLVRARWILLVAGVLLGTIGGVMYAGTLVVEHRSTAVVYFAVDRAKTASDYTAGSSFAQSVMPSFAQIVKSPVVLDPVIRELDLQTTPSGLAGRIQVDVPSNTTVMNVTVTDTTSAGAATTANMVIRFLDDAVRTLSPRGDEDNPAMKMSSVSPAVASGSQSAVGSLTFGLVGAVGGLVLAVAIVGIWESLTRPVRSVSDVEFVTSMPVLATIAFNGDRVAASDGPRGSEGAVGTFVLRTNLMAACEKRGGVKSVAVVPVTANGDARAVAVDLATVMARARERILFVDADLRSGSVATMMDAEPAPGLAEILRGTAKLGQVLQPTSGLDFVAAGKADGDAAELLASSWLKPFFRVESGRYKMLLTVGGAAIPVADGATLAAAAEVTVLVARRGHTRRRDLADAVDRLSGSRGIVAGIVLVERRSGISRVLSGTKSRIQDGRR
ncbi:succinoglycan biosynthesis transport protein ExoP [Rhodococcus sp. 27YEA15]|uniref:Wzz/FepE/Etk N-terminal domain-containing protein n=1 Tax=Rhodococcus sp. 27YEA15 TaxID=3156259 RepID=UPI003C7C2A1F